MPRKTKLESHLTLKELKSLISSTRETVARQQLKVIYMIMEGMTQREVAEKSGYSTAWVHTIVRRFNQFGPEKLKDHRKDNPGRPYRLSPEVREEMKKLVSSPPSTGGLWTGPLLVEWVQARTGEEDIDKKRGWEWLRQLGCNHRLKRRRSSKKSQVGGVTQRAS
jgi:transposase